MSGGGHGRKSRHRRGGHGGHGGHGGRRARKPRPGSDDGGGGGGHGGGDSRWMVTYADMLTLLMVLFLVLWVLSTIDLAKFEKFKSGLGDFGNPAATASAGAGGGAEGDEPCPNDTSGGETTSEEDGHSTEEDGSHSTEAPAEETDSTEAPAEEAGAAETAGPVGTARIVRTVATRDTPGGAQLLPTAKQGGGGDAEPEPEFVPCLGPGDAGVPGDGGGAAGGGGGAAGGGGGALLTSDLPEVAQSVQQAIAAADLPDVVSVSVQERGLVIIVTTDNVLFGSGSADITSEGAALVGVVAQTLTGFSNRIVVEGHTDKRPLRREGYDNWDLSVDRAVSVIKLLRDQFGIDSDRLTAAGFGERRPIAEGDDEASLARNRRVEIVVLADADAEIDSAPTGTDAPEGTPTTDAPTTDAPTTEAPATASTEPALEG